MGYLKKSLPKMESLALLQVKKGEFNARNFVENKEAANELVKTNQNLAIDFMCDYFKPFQMKNYDDSADLKLKDTTSIAIPKKDSEQKVCQRNPSSRTSFYVGLEQAFDSLTDHHDKMISLSSLQDISRKNLSPKNVKIQGSVVSMSNQKYPDSSKDEPFESNGKIYAFYPRDIADCGDQDFDGLNCSISACYPHKDNILDALEKMLNMNAVELRPYAKLLKQINDKFTDKKVAVKQPVITSMASIASKRSNAFLSYCKVPSGKSSKVDYNLYQTDGFSVNNSDSMSSHIDIDKNCHKRNPLELQANFSHENKENVYGNKSPCHQVPSFYYKKISIMASIRFNPTSKEACLVTVGVWLRI